MTAGRQDGIPAGFTPKTAPRVTDDRALFVISVAAELAGVHPQTLRSYERRGLIRPARTEGRARRYSRRDIAHVQLIQRLTREHGMNLAGVAMVLTQTRELEAMHLRVAALEEALEQARTQADRERRRQRGALAPIRGAIERYRPGVPWSWLGDGTGGDGWGEPPEGETG